MSNRGEFLIVLFGFAGTYQTTCSVDILC